MAESEGRLNVTSEGERKRERAGVYSVVPTEWREEGNSDVYKALCTVQSWNLQEQSVEGAREGHGRYCNSGVNRKDK